MHKDRKVAEKNYGTEDVSDSAKEENSNDDESLFDEREDYETDDHAAVAFSADSAFLISETAEACEDGASDCKSKVNNEEDAQERVGFVDSTSGNSKQTSNIASQAAQEADIAQEIPDKQSSKRAMSQLAEKAIEAALTAEQAIFAELQHGLRESKKAATQTSRSLKRMQMLLCVQQLRTLTEAVQTAQSNLKNSEQAAQGAQQELGEKTQLLAAAKNRVEQLLRELKAARVDYANTKQAAYKASAASHIERVSRHLQIICHRFIVAFLSSSTPDPEPGGFTVVQ